MVGGIAATINPVACGPNPNSHLKFQQQSSWRKGIRCYAPLNQKPVFDKQQSISIVFKEVDLGHKSRMMVEIRQRTNNGISRRGFWWDYAARPETTNSGPRSILRLLHDLTTVPAFQQDLQLLP